MKKIILILITFVITFFSYNSNIKSAYAIGIFNEKGDGENIQHKRITDNDYNDICYSRIVVFGNISHERVEVKIGDSLGYFEKSTSVVNKHKIKIGEEMTFKHYTVEKGYFEVKVNNKLYDTKVFVK